MTAHMTCAEAPDLRRCSTLEILVGLYEHERALDALSGWPNEPKRWVARELGRWRKANRDRAVVCTRTHATKGQCVLSLWHQEATPWTT